MTKSEKINFTIDIIVFLFIMYLFYNNFPHI